MAPSTGTAESSGALVPLVPSKEVGVNLAEAKISSESFAVMLLSSESRDSRRGAKGEYTQLPV